MRFVTLGGGAVEQAELMQAFILGRKGEIVGAGALSSEK